MKIDTELQIEVDYEDTDLPRTVKELQPVLWIEGNSYCCLLGPDCESGVFGCGDTPAKALLNWDEHLRERIKDAKPEDEVAWYIIDVLRASKYDIN